LHSCYFKLMNGNLVRDYFEILGHNTNVLVWIPCGSTIIHRYSYCFSSDIICCPYDEANTIIAQRIQPPDPKQPYPKKYVSVFGNAVPRLVFERLRAAFCSTSSFWKEHGYQTTTLGGEAACGYFSYAHPFKTASKSKQVEKTSETKIVSHLINQVAHSIYKIAKPDFPELEECNFIEWWAHCRPHCHGHQMHFDSDNEGVGGIRNPIASSVLYLSPSGVGGPTLVTPQTLQSKRVASQGWLVPPTENAVAVFDGTLLHGVIPGRAVPSNRYCTSEYVPTATNMGTFDQSSTTFQLQTGPRRITLMIAFWKELRMRPQAPIACLLYPQNIAPITNNKSNYTEGG